MFSLKDKKVVVTGAGSGIGRAVALLFSQQGAIVYIIDLNSENSNETLRQIEMHNGVGYIHTCDVSNQEQVLHIFKTIVDFSILVNCAGIAHVGKADTTSEGDFDRVYQINVKGTYNCLYSAIPFLKQQKNAVILNIASIAALVGITDRFAYSMSKGAVFAMTLSVARDYINDNIRCNSISPARIHTPFVDGFISKNYPGNESEMFNKLSESQPIGRMGKPDEIAALALFLCSEESAFITGCDYPIDGGFIKLNN